MSYNLSRIKNRTLILQNFGKGEFSIRDYISFSRAILDCKKLCTVKEAMVLFRTLEQYSGELEQYSDEAIDYKHTLEKYSPEVRMIALYCLDAEQAKDLRDAMADIARCKEAIDIIKE